MFHISPSISILRQKILKEKLLQSTFCDQMLYITDICRVVSHSIKTTLQNNFHTGSYSILPAHGRKEMFKLYNFGVSMC